MLGAEPLWCICDTPPPVVTWMTGLARTLKEDYYLITISLLSIGACVFSPDRNLVKRRLRHLLSERTETVPSGSRIVVRALGPSGDLSFSELCDALDSALNRAKKSQEKLLEASATRGHVNG